jgi:hypothetical protein
MKKLVLILLFSTFLTNVFAQNVIGQWNGLLSVQGTELSIVFHITQNGEQYSGTMDSPDQGVKGIPLTSVSYTNNELNIVLKDAGIEFTGKVTESEKISGTFKQSGMTFPLELNRKMPLKSALNRPQEPQKPYPYYTEEVTFINEKGSIELSGTLTLPEKEGSFPAVILITGSGPQNRNEELLGHKPFLVLSDFLTRQGIATLRFDDRGTGFSKGNFELSTTADFASDVEAAINYLMTRKEVNKDEIGLIGHSEGGIIACSIANGNQNVAYIVLMAGSAVRGDELLRMQQAAIGKAQGMSDEQIRKLGQLNNGGFDIVLNSKDDETLKKDLSEYLKKVMNEFPENERPKGTQADLAIQQMVSQMTTPWMKFFLKHNPYDDLKKVTIPVLAIIGSNDLQVPSNENLSAIQNALREAGNDKSIIKVLPGLNHLFQESSTGLPQEYGKIEQTISPLALQEMGDFINSVVSQ